MSFLRQILLGLTFTLAALGLSACGDGPSADNAKEAAVKITTASYNNDVATIMSYFPGQADLSADEKKMAETKLGQMLKLSAMYAQKHGGVEKIEATDCTISENGRALVNLRTTFKDGTTKDSEAKLQWDEASSSYKIKK